MSATETSARDEILRRVRAALPAPVGAPAPRAPSVDSTTASSLLDGFIAAATLAGAAVVPCPRSEVARVANGAVTDGSRVLSLTAAVRSTVTPTSDLHALASLDLFVCESTLGVAENGAVWLPTSERAHRAALFLATRVTVLVSEEHLVRDLHDAYARIDVRAHPFGVFVAGPSKTADIEQSLVIGAHGPKELTLIVIRTERPLDA